MGAPAVTDDPLRRSNGPDHRGPRREQLAVSAVLVGVIGVALWLAWPGFELDWYHDESWRIDVVRSDDPIGRMIDPGTTPTPLAWVYAMRAGLAFVPYSFTAARLVSFLAFVTWSVILFVLLRDLLGHGGHPAAAPSTDRGPHVVSPTWLAIATTAVLAITHVVGRHVDYLNNYFFEAAYVTFAVLAARRAPDGRAWHRGLVSLLALSPLALTGGLLAVPALGLGALLAARRLGRRSDVVLVVIGAVVGAALAAVVVLGLWGDGRGSETVPLAVQWQEEIAGSVADVPGLLARSARQVQNGLVGWSSIGGDWLPLRESGWWVALTAPLVVVGAVVGARAVHRTWSWLLPGLAITQGVAVAASLVADVPMTAVRTNLSWILLVDAVVVLGWVLVVARSARAVADRTSRAVGRAVFAAGVLLVLGALWHPPRPGGVDWTPRGLRGDLQPVADSPAAHNLVLDYVAMTQWVVHDRLVNDAPPGRSYEIRAPVESDADFEYGPLAGLVRAELEPGDALWCVIPDGLPEPFRARACQVDGAPVVEIHRSQGVRAEVRGYLVE